GQQRFDKLDLFFVGFDRAKKIPLSRGTIPHPNIGYVASKRARSAKSHLRGSADATHRGRKFRQLDELTTVRADQKAVVGLEIRSSVQKESIHRSDRRKESCRVWDAATRP